MFIRKRNNNGLLMLFCNSTIAFFRPPSRFLGPLGTSLRHLGILVEPSGRIWKSSWSQLEGPPWGPRRSGWLFLLPDAPW